MNDAPSFQKMARALACTPEQIRACMVRNRDQLRKMYAQASQNNRVIGGYTAAQLATRLASVEERIAAYDAEKGRLL